MRANYDVKAISYVVMMLILCIILVGCATIAQEGLTFQNVDNIIGSPEMFDQPVLNLLTEHNAHFVRKSPNQVTTALVSASNGRQNIFILDIEGNQLERLTDDQFAGVSIVDIRWHDNGNKIDILVREDHSDKLVQENQDDTPFVLWTYDLQEQNLMTQSRLIDANHLYEWLSSP